MICWWQVLLTCQASTRALSSRSHWSEMCDSTALKAASHDVGMRNMRCLKLISISAWPSRVSCSTKQNLQMDGERVQMAH